MQEEEEGGGRKCSWKCDERRVWRVTGWEVEWTAEGMEEVKSRQGRAGRRKKRSDVESAWWRWFQLMTVPRERPSNKLGFELILKSNFQSMKIAPIWFLFDCMVVIRVWCYTICLKCNGGKKAILELADILTYFTSGFITALWAIPPQWQIPTHL